MTDPSTEQSGRAPGRTRATAASHQRLAEEAIERANKASNQDFVKEYLQPRDDGWPAWTHPRTGAAYAMRVLRAGELGAARMDACLALVEATSGDDYRRSAGGWHAAAKAREMASPDLRYVLVLGGEGGRVAGFTSMMATFEDGEPVVYCYEIHLEPELQGTGLGALLMGLVARAGEGVATVRKTMLTCFVRNERGRRFYERLGYAVDEASPRERKLRGGRVVVPDYVILSRPTARARRGRETGAEGECAAVRGE